MELQIGVKAIIKNKRNQYLLIKRNEILPGSKEPYWTIPGGRIDPKEKLYEGLTREIKEETGLTIKGDAKIIAAQDIFPPNKLTHIVRLTFVVKAEGTIEIDKDPENDHSEFRWVTLAEAAKLNCESYLTSIFKHL